MYPIFDSHAHYDDERFSEDRDEAINMMKERGVGCIINAASDLDSAESSIALAEKHDFIFAAVGVHPHEADSWDDSSCERLCALAAHPKAVAIGEIGLDYHYDISPREVQRGVFRQQLSIAKSLNMPVVIHDREAHGDMYDILREFAPLRGVVHCFSGSCELAAETVKLGLHIGLGGAVTFKNAKTPVEVATYVPADRLLLETDAPYMTPVPYRGKRCTSDMILLTAAKIAEVRETSVDVVLKTAAENASALFGINLQAAGLPFAQNM